MPARRALEALVAYDRAFSPASDLGPAHCMHWNYRRIAADLRRLPGVHTVADIGCAWATQQAWLARWRYVGLDMLEPQGFGKDGELRPIPFFRLSENADLRVGHFPEHFDPSWNRPGFAFVASMSLGYWSAVPAPETLRQTLGRMSAAYVCGHRFVHQAFELAFGAGRVLLPAGRGLWRGEGAGLVRYTPRED